MIHVLRFWWTRGGSRRWEYRLAGGGGAEGIPDDQPILEIEREQVSYHTLPTRCRREARGTCWQTEVLRGRGFFNQRTGSARKTADTAEEVLVWLVALDASAVL